MQGRNAGGPAATNAGDNQTIKTEARLTSDCQGKEHGLADGTPTPRHARRRPARRISGGWDRRVESAVFSVSRRSLRYDEGAATSAPFQTLLRRDELIPLLLRAASCIRFEGLITSDSPKGGTHSQGGLMGTEYAIAACTEDGKD